MGLTLWSRVAVLAAAHLVCIAVLHALLSVYDPDPNGFRFDSSPTTLWLVVGIMPPALVGLLAVRKRTVLVLAAIHAASPLLLLPNMWDPSSDLNFAALLWWFPLPLLFGVIAVVDRARGDGARLPQHVERVGRPPLG